MTTTHEVDPRSRSMESWRASLAVLASRGEVDGPRVEEAHRALSWWRCHRLFEREVERGNLTTDVAAIMLEQLLRRPAEPVADAPELAPDVLAASAAGWEGVRFETAKPTVSDDDAADLPPVDG